jgi:membrane fusion protein (multidrug efflux system)
MRSHTNITLYFLALLVTTAVAWAYFTQVDVAFEAGGILRPDGDVVHVTAESAGRISSIRFSEGEQVRKGDVLIQIDGRDLALRERMLESRIRAAKRHVRELSATLEQASVADDQEIALQERQIEASRRFSEVTVQQSERSLEQSRQLFAAGLVAKRVYEDAQNATERAKAERRHAGVNASSKSILLKTTWSTCNSSATHSLSKSSD